MSTLPKIVEKVKRKVQAGVEVDESRLDDKFIEDLILTARGIVFSNLVKSKMADRINDAWVQVLTPDDMTPVKCDDGSVKFECPTVVTIDQRKDGFVYVGHKNGLNEFVRIRAGHSNLSNHSKFKSISKIFWDFSGDNLGKHYIRIIGNPKLEQMTIKLIANDPLAVPNYRPDIDHFPVDAVTENDIVEMVAINLLKNIRGMVPDVISDSQDNTGVEYRNIKNVK